MEITNSYTKEFLQIVLNKPLSSITDDDFQKLVNICFSSHDIGIENGNKEFAAIMAKCPSLEQLTLKKTILTKPMVEIIKNTSIKTIYLDGCAFEDEETINFPSELTVLSMQKSFLDNYSGLFKALPESMEKLAIIYPADETKIKGSELNRLTSLKQLVLEGCIVDFTNMLLPNCDTLEVFNTELNADAIKVISAFPNISTMYLSEIFLTLPGMNELRNKCKIKTNLMELAFEEPEEDQLENIPTK